MFMTLARHYSIGAESLLLELGQYNADKQVYPITIRNLTQTVKLTMNGSINMPRDSARTFKQEYINGLIRPQVAVRAGNGEVLTAALINDSDSSIYEYVKGEFIAVAELKRIEAERERQTAGEMVNVSGGCFTANGKQTCLDAFRIGKYDVTQGQYQRIMGNNPSHFSSCGDDCPVEKVSWHDAQAFISKLNRKTGKLYRLPTEVEWEYACRSGGKNEEYCGGNDIDAVAWYDDNSGSKTHQVGQKQPNGLGLYDMSGNVWQWVQDWYGSDFPSSGNNPQGASSGSRRVGRGGSWDREAALARSENRRRNNVPPDFSSLRVGFRLASPVQ